MKLNDTVTIEKLKKDTMPMVEALKNGKSAKEIACDIYCTLDGKTPAIANLMAEDMEKTIETYHTEIDKCLESDDAYIEEKLNECVEDTDDPMERCEMYHKIIVVSAAHAIYCDGEPDAEERAEKFINDNINVTFDAENIEETERELKQTAAEALKNSSLTVIELSDILDNFDGDIIGGFSFGRESKDIKLILSMQAYVNALKGEYDDFGKDSTMEQIVYGVCGGVDTCAAAAIVGAANGDSGKESLAIKILRAVGLVVGYIIAIKITGLIYAGIAAILLHFTSFTFGVCAAIAIAATITLLIATNYDDAIAEGMSEIFASLGYAIKTGTNVTLTGIRKLIELTAPGVKKAYGWVKTTVVTILSKFFGKPGPGGDGAAVERSYGRSEESAELEYEEQEHTPEQNPALA